MTDRAPDSGVALSSTGTVYAARSNGGYDGYGTVYQSSGSTTPSLPEIADFGLKLHDGLNPEYGSLVADSSGTLYGTTLNQDITYSGIGPTFSFTMAGNYAVIATPDSCSSGLTLDGGVLYGTDMYGGGGTVYKLDSSAVDGFDEVSSGYPAFYNGFPDPSSLTVGSDGNLYGTVYQGGSHGYGAVFSVKPDGSQAYDIYDFQDGTDGYEPMAALTVGPDGTLYGTTSRGGANSDYGTIFKITPAHVFSTLYSFDEDNTGAYPYGKMVYNLNDGYLYGTTSSGTASYYGSVFRIKPDGSGFSTVYSFGKTSADGNTPYGDLMIGSDGKIYGTTSQSGYSSVPGGTVFALTTTGQLTYLHMFPNSNSDGNTPYSGLLENIDGNLYGFTYAGGVQPYNGVNVGGVLYKIATQLPLITSANPSPAAPGASIIITGVNLTGASAVSFNGVAASFTVNSATQITATVPSGATSGQIAVTTPNGSGKSAANFTVTATAGSGLKSVTLSPTSTQGGTAATTANRVYWNGNAPANEVVTLKSSNTAVAAVPSSVTISSASSSHAFTITTKAVTATQTVTITATSGGVTQTATLTVTAPPAPAGLKSVTLSPTSTEGGSAATTANRVYWNGNAPASETVTLKSSNTAVAAVPSSVTISSGSSSHTFTITTKAVTSQQAVTITATSGGVSQSATLTVTP